LEAIIAFRLGLEDIGIGGGTPGAGAESGVTAGGLFEGTGGVAGLLLKPISRADRRGGGAITLFALWVESFEASLRGNAGGGGRSLTVD
jgi:hypothetical protein